MSASRRSKPFPRELLERATALLLLILIAPLMLLIAGLVRVGIGSPVLFRQLRPGLGGRPFRILKFRTMKEPTTETERYASDRQRMTRLGSWLRRTSLDELPELINVLRGDMALVGPRPLLMEYLPRYNQHQARRHEVRPGITGWAQVNGRNEVDWQKRLDMDVWYVDNHSLRLDIAILARTVPTVISGRGVSQAGHATIEYFGGTPGESG